jgi:hypothetical protein
MSKFIDLTGKVINGFTVVGLSLTRKGFWDVICTCGKDREPMRSDNIKKHSGKCTCPYAKGDKINKLTFIGYSYMVGKHSYCSVRCDCGKVFNTRVDNFQKMVKGCGECPNTHWKDDLYVYIDVSTNTYKDAVCKVDLCDYDKVCSIRWWAYGKKGGNIYVQGIIEGKQESIHRFINKTPENLVTDHINGDGLDNTRLNLRTVTSLGNSKNRRISSNNTSGHMGVKLNKNNTYYAYIMVDNKQINLGTYSNFEDAVTARKEAEILYGFHENHGRS